MSWSKRPTMAALHLATNQACKVHAHPPTADRRAGDQARNEEMQVILTPPPPPS